MNIAVVGSGGREHTLAWKIKQSPKCGNIFMMPGNAGTSKIAINLDIQVDDFKAIKSALLSNQIKLVIIGPEVPLVKGLRDYLLADPNLKDLMIIGPGAKGAQLEGSKSFSKDFMARHHIPTATAKKITPETIDKGIAFLKKLKSPYVLKADGLAAGKGVVISEDINEAIETLKEMLLEGKFGEASTSVLIEEFLHGIELSVFVLTDGKNYVTLPEAKDYKRIGEGDKGLNTGGMGAISPVPFADEDFMKKVEEKVTIPTVHGLKKDDIPYIGFIFIGLMNVNGAPYVIEYNARMGDPETQAVIPRIKNDFLEVLIAAAKSDLDKIDLEFDDRCASTVVMVSGGYPEKYKKGYPISGISQSEKENGLIFHAGTSLKSGATVNSGGRVLGITGFGDTMQQATQAAYAITDTIDWQDLYYRKDIGKDLLNFLK